MHPVYETDSSVYRPGMTWTRISRRILPCPPSALWPSLADFTRWPDWDPDLTGAELHGPAEAGTTGFLVPSGFRGRVHSRVAEPFTITSLVQDREIAIRQPIPFGAMDLALRLSAVDGGTEFVQEITLAGPMRAVMVAVIGGDVVKHFDVKCAKLVSLAAQAEHDA
ncbi:SRPBCC family protein [Amycolatopsis thailandensis]|uniref:SRPBCC family protein n=1 Tax=Amycolatopsis thailandensis TaxID=589330 RepID=UPI0036617BE8